MVLRIEDDVTYLPNPHLEPMRFDGGHDWLGVARSVPCAGLEHLDQWRYTLGATYVAAATGLAIVATI